MKNLFIAALTGLITLSAQAQVSETRKSSSATTIDVKNGIEVIFIQSNTPTLKVEADNAASLSRIVTEYKGSTLKVYMKDVESAGVEHAKAKVYVSQNNLDTFKASTGATIGTEGVVDLPELNFNLSSGATFIGTVTVKGTCSIKATGGSGFKGRVTTDVFKANVTGGAYVRVIGKANNADIYCGSASVMADNFQCKKANVRAQNASYASIFANEYIKADTDTSSSITYYGNPTDTDLGTNGYAVAKTGGKVALN
jgi:hypothetical protein